MKLIRLEAQNVMRLKSVVITPTGPVVVLGGKNGAGKSSVIEAIVMLLGGTSKQCEVPVRRGAKAMRIVGHLDDLIITRVQKAGGGGSLVITSADGKAKFSSPQTMLDQFVGRLAFDPLEFLRMKAAQQRELLRSLVGLDFTALDANRKALFDARADAGRDVHGREQQIENMPHFDGTALKEVSISELSAELGAAQESNRQRSVHVKSVAEYEAKIATIAQETKRTKDDLVEAERRVGILRENLNSFDRMRKETENRLGAAEKVLEGIPEVDCQPILGRINESDELNKRVRANQAKARLQTQFDESRTEYDRLDAEIKAIDADKEKQLSAAAFPIEGLSFSESGVSFNGLPFEQASSAEQLRVSVAMGLALNPQLKLVLIRDGSLLDRDSRRMVEEMVEQAGGQAWLEVVTTDPKQASVIIEDGEIKP